MAKVLLIGCGQLGTAIAKKLYDAGHELVAVRKSAHALAFAKSTIQADVTDAATLTELHKIKPEIVIYCVSASAQDDENYFQHYVLGLKNILNTQTLNTHLKHVFFVSSTRVYGQQSALPMDEAIPAEAADYGGARLLQAEELLAKFSSHTSSLRLSGIYGRGRLYLINMAKDQARWPAVNHWSNRIHQEDAAAFAAYLVEMVLANQVINDCYIVTDDLPTQQYDVLNWLALQMRIQHATVFNSPAIEGKRLSNQRMKSTGFKLKYPNFQHGYAEIISDIINEKTITS